MAKSQLISSILLVLLAIHSTTAEEPVQKPTEPAVEGASLVKPAERKVEVVVEGVVNCQSCQTINSWGLSGAKPIVAATVSVICKDHRNRVSYYKSFKTDKNGYFYAELKGFEMSHSFLDHPLHSCKVKLVASPLDNCNHLTNVNYGLYGAPLRYEDKRLTGPYYEAVIYAAGPLAFRPAYCAPKTET